MKRLIAPALSLLLLAGCSGAPNVDWQQGNQAQVNDQAIDLSSNLWKNLMPTIGNQQDQRLHGSLYIHTNSVLPANLTIQSVVLRQGDHTWIISGDDLVLTTDTENQWQVSFVWKGDMSLSEPIDVALALQQNKRQAWLIEKQVKVDQVQ